MLSKEEDIKNINRLIKSHYQSREKLLSSLNSKVQNESSKYSKAHLSHWIKGTRQIPLPVKEWLNDEVFLRCTPWGSFSIMKGLPVWFDGIVNILKSSQDVDMALDLAMRCQAAGDYDPKNKKEEPWVWAALSAFIGVIFRTKDDLESANAAFEDSVSLLEQIGEKGRHIYPRYMTNNLSIKRELAYRQYNENLMSEDDYKKALEDTKFSQKKLLEEEMNNGSLSCEDHALMLRHLLRLSSLLNDRKAFDEFLNEARTCQGFGKGEEDRDLKLRDLLKEENDCDGDFHNARAYQSTYELFGMNSNKSSRKSMSAVIALIVFLGIGNIHLGIDETSGSNICSAKVLCGGDYAV